MQRLADWIQSATQRGAVPVLAGANGDMDTIGSAIALASSDPGMMACGLHMGRLATKLCNELSAPFRKLKADSPWPKNLGGIIIVDSAAMSQTGMTLPDGIPICVIDHHSTSNWQFNTGDLEIKSNARSTTQMVFEYLNQFSSSTLTNEVRKLLLAGLITDTGRFRHADAAALECGANLVNGGSFEYQEFVEHIQQDEITASDRGAIIKALSRVKSHEVNKWNLGITHGGILEGRIASLLVQAGCEVAVVARYRDGITRLTARAPRLSTIEGIHLGKMMEQLAQQLGGDGGGHDGAAGWTGKSDRIAAETAFINILANTRRKAN